MAKKKVSTVPPCAHCGVVFRNPLRWCPKCSDHIGEYSWFKGGDICDRCASGENDIYLEWRKGHADRVKAAVALTEDPKNGCDCGVVKAFEE